MKRQVTAIAFILAALPLAASAEDAPLIVSATNLSTPPTLRCRPATLQRLSACAIFLPEGEHITPAKISADSVRWELEPETFGPDGQDAVVYVKEKSDEVGIETNVYLMTDAPGGIYRVLVRSDAAAPSFSEVHFSHRMTVEEQRARAAAQARQAREAAATALKTADDADSGLQAIKDHPCTVRRDEQLYTWDAKSPIAPISVFLDDEYHTCVQFAETTQVVPLPYDDDSKPIHVIPRRYDNMLILDGLQGAFDLKDGNTLLKITRKPGSHPSPASTSPAT
jgi:hypothetical protein